MKLNLKENGIIDFFFPIKTKLRIEVITSVNNFGIYREFFTFRALATHYFYEWFIISAREFAKVLDIVPKFAFQIGAIALDATSDATPVTGATTVVSVNHTCTGSNRVLVAGSFDPGINPTNAPTYNSVAMTQGIFPNPNNAYGTTLSYQVAPSTGTNSLTYTASSNYSVNNGWIFGISFSGASQSGQPDATGQTTTASAASLAVNITTIADNSYIIDAIAVDPIVTSITPNGAQTTIGNHNATTTVAFAGSYKQLASHGATTMSWSWTGNTAADLSTLSISPAAAVTNSAFLMFMGPQPQQ